MSTIATVLLVVLIVALINPELTNQIRGALGRASGAGAGGTGSPAVQAFFGFSGAIAPDLAILSGFVGDIVAGNYRYSMTSIVAIISVVVNKLIWGRGELSGDLTRLGQTVSSTFSGGPGPAGPIASAAAASTGLPAATTALDVLSSTIPAVGIAGPTRSSGQTPRPNVDVVDGWGGAGPMSPSPQTQGRRSSSPSTLRSSVRSAMRGTRVRSPSVRNVSFGRPAGGVTSSGRFVQPSQRTRTGGARDGLEEVDFDEGQKGGARIPANFNPCTIRGLGGLDTQNSPMGVAALVTVFFIYFLDMSVNSKRTPGEIAGNFVFGMLVLALNIGSYIFFECYGQSKGDVLLASVKAASVGVVIGGFAFLMYNYTTDYSKQWLPLDPSPAAISGDGSSSSGTTPGTMQPCPPTPDGRPQHRQGGQCVPLTGAGVPQCGGPNDDGQFVCDAYVNGKRISTSVVDGSA